MQGTVGVGRTSCFARAISSIARNLYTRRRDRFDVVIHVDMKHEVVLGTSLDIHDKLAIKVAEQLGLMDQEHRRVKADAEELWYYTYGLQDATLSIKRLASSFVPQIFKILSTKRYLAAIENLDEPITMVDDRLGNLSLCLPPPQWNDGSFWLISATSRDVYNSCRPNYGALTESYSTDDMVILTLYSLHQAAKYILGAIGHKDEKYWHHVAVRCFLYATMLLVPHYSSSHAADGCQQSSAGLAQHIASDELIRQWAAQGILVLIDTARTGEITGNSSSYNGNYNDIYQVGNVILEAFREYSLLPQFPFSLSPAMTEKAEEEEEATKSAAHFLAWHNLIAEHHTMDELCDRGLERMQWISHVGDQGWHLSWEWLSHGASGPTTLISRHYSQQSRLLDKLDYLLDKLSSLRVLDLSYSSIESLPPSLSCLQRLQLLYVSYTPLKSLPPSIYCLQKLQFLSLRGCYNMTSPFGFISSDSTDDIMTTPLPAANNNSNTEIISSLLHLDLSYSNVKTFHCDFFCRMPNLQELLLLKCSNLEELPPSTAALSSLEKLELSGTQIKCFPGKMFEDMNKKLRSVKIIENKELLFAPAELFSKASVLTNLHIEGCESITEVEVTLERHPSLRSFSFSGAPHMKRLSLRGCRKLEYVDINEVGALEELDLSATAIKELPDSIPNLPQLRQLLLMGVPTLRRFPWHKVQRFPDVFCLDQCPSNNRAINNHSDHPLVAQMCVSDSRLFYSFNDATRDLVRAGSLLKSFYVRVTSCKATARKMQDGEDMVTSNTLEVAPPPAYDDVNHQYLTTIVVSMVSMDDVPAFRETTHHMEISAADQYPHGLEYLLQVSKSISMLDDTHVSCLSYLSSLDEECKLQWCHKTEQVFTDKMQNLKNAYVSHLKSLAHFLYRPVDIYSGYDFNSLKHLVLEYCPRLKGVVPRGCELRSLETLDILFCYNLKAIFYGSFLERRSSSGDYTLPSLRRIRLQELPLLEHLLMDDPVLTAPAWEELHVRGCCSLRRLPRLIRRQQQPDKKHKAVKVSGERAWWAKLSWDDDAPRRRDGYEPRLPPVFTSHRERVVIESYLR